MNHWTRRVFALAAPLLLTGCLWGPGKFQSDLTLKKDNSFVLNYRGEIVIQLPPDEAEKSEPWKPDMVHCYNDGRVETGGESIDMSSAEDRPRPCTAAELAKARTSGRRPRPSATPGPGRAACATAPR